MKRSTPLRRTELKRGTTPLKRSRPKPMSDKRRGAAEIRKDVIMVVRARDVTCRAEHLWPEVACGGRLDVHEPNARSRNEGDWLDPDRCLLICRQHHEAIHGATRRARALGLLI